VYKLVQLTFLDQLFDGILELYAEFSTFNPDMLCKL